MYHLLHIRVQGMYIVHINIECCCAMNSHTFPAVTGILLMHATHTLKIKYTAPTCYMQCKYIYIMQTCTRLCRCYFY